MTNDLNHQHKQQAHYQRLLIACFPKSGSTYLTEMLSALPDFQRVSLVPGYERREQELDYRSLLKTKLLTKHCVAQHHVKYSSITEQYLKLFQIKPVVLVRHIFDVVYSLKDHYRKYFTEGPASFVPHDINSWEDDRILNFIVDLTIPWYFNFFVGWQSRANTFFITYESLLQDAQKTLRQIGQYLNLNLKEADIIKAIDEANRDDKMTYKNQCIKGRGEALPEVLKNKIKTYASYYDIDFSMMGI